ncbi:MAG: DUF2723 domain-containing protein [Caldilineales bacterium]|nr:DUF2723 domain-containing protein [Caldilineales bacterium]
MANRWLLVALVFSLALALYLRTLVPGVFVSDFAEFQYGPARLALPHPNGFPLYMLLGWLASHLPLGSVAWRMNALSAIGGALAAALTAGFVLRLSGRRAVALLAGGLLALSPTFWFYSLAAERYTLNLALLVAAVWSAWEAGQRQSRRLAYLSALALGLGLATHPSDALLTPFWLGYLAWRLPSARRSWRFWIGLAAAGAAPLLLFLYVPWRWLAFSNEPLAAGLSRSTAIYRGLVHVWYQPALTWELLRNYVLGLGGYATGLLGGGWREALPLAAALLPVWRPDAPPLLLAAAALGLVGLARRDAALAAALAGFVALMVLMTAYIRQGKPEAYLLPATWVVMVGAGLALDAAAGALSAVLRRRRRSTDAETPPRGRRMEHGLAVGVAATLLVLLAHRFPALDHSRWTDTRRAWEVTLRYHDLPEAAALLGHWSDMTPLWYIQQIEGRRSDLLGLFPPDPDQVIDPWLAAGGALFLAAPLHGYAPDLAERYALAPWGKLVRILPADQGASSCPSLAGSAATPHPWPLAIEGWELHLADAASRPSALRLCWRSRQELPPDVFLRLVLQPADPAQRLEVNGPLLSEWRPSSVVPAGEGGLAVLPFALPQGTPPGLYAVELLPYRLLADGRTEAWPGVEPLVLGRATVPPTRRLVRSELEDETMPPLPLRLGPLRLRAWRVSSLPVRPGDPLEVDLLWEAAETVEGPLAVALGFRRLPDGRAAGAAKEFAVDGAVLQPGAVVRTRHVLSAPRGLGDHRYLVVARVRLGERWRPALPLPLGLARVQDRPHRYDLPPEAIPVQASFGDVAALAGYTVERSQTADGLTLTLFWRAVGEPEVSYTVSVRLVDREGRTVAQHDGIPGAGALPTTLWVRDEVIADPHPLTLPSGHSGEPLGLQVVMYDSITGARLPVASALSHTDDILEVGLLP